MGRTTTRIPASNRNPNCPRRGALRVGSIDQALRMIFRRIVRFLPDLYLVASVTYRVIFLSADARADLRRRLSRFLAFEVSRRCSVPMAPAASVSEPVERMNLRCAAATALRLFTPIRAAPWTTQSLL